MSIYEFLEQLPHDVRTLPQIQAMANLISAQSSLIKKQKEKIVNLQKALDELKDETSLKNEKSPS